jgi:hypothetical protein
MLLSCSPKHSELLNPFLQSWSIPVSEAFVFGTEKLTEYYRAILEKFQADQPENEGLLPLPVVSRRNLSSAS